ncbi:MAG TPA: hypothetical protein VE093_47075 [Polyangiaceae bacterium]|nr:hypothetical protein [Polyangiaceae bacterium]
MLASEHRPDESDAELARATPGEGAPATPEDAARNARLWGAVGAVLHARDRDREAVRIFEAVIAAAEQGEPIEPLTLANVYLHFSSVLEVLGESLRARGMCRRMLETRRSIIGVPSLRVGLGLIGLGSSFIRSGRIDEARAALPGALQGGG